MFVLNLKSFFSLNFFKILINIIDSIYIVIIIKNRSEDEERNIKVISNKQPKIESKKENKEIVKDVIVPLKNVPLKENKNEKEKNKKNKKSQSKSKSPTRKTSVDNKKKNLGNNSKNENKNKKNKKKKEEDSFIAESEEEDSDFNADDYKDFEEEGDFSAEEDVVDKNRKRKTRKTKTEKYKDKSLDKSKENKNSSKINTPVKADKRKKSNDHNNIDSGKKPINNNMKENIEEEFNEEDLKIIEFAFAELEKEKKAAQEEEIKNSLSRPNKSIHANQNDNLKEKKSVVNISTTHKKVRLRLCD